MFYLFAFGIFCALILTPIIVLISIAGSTVAKKKARQIISGEINATKKEINRIIDSIASLNKSPTEEERGMIEKLRKIRQEAGCNGL